MFPRPGKGVFYKGFVTCAIALLLVFPCLDRALCYVPPSAELAALMARNFSGLRTAVIIQRTTLVEPLGAHADVTGRERLWLKSPGLYALETIGGPGKEETVPGG